MHNGHPGEFPRVLAAMMRHQTGDIKITQNALRAVSLSNSLIWRQTEYSHYFFTHIPGKGPSRNVNVFQLGGEKK